jgi:hypothetical protein
LGKDRNDKDERETADEATHDTVASVAQRTGELAVDVVGEVPLDNALHEARLFLGVRAVLVWCGCGQGSNEAMVRAHF